MNFRRKTMLHLVWPIALASLAACQAKQEHKTKDTLIFGFESSQVPAEIKLSNASAELVSKTEGTTEGAQALRVKFSSKHNEHAAIHIEPAKPFDWSELSDFNLAFDMANQGKHSTYLWLKVTDVDGKGFSRAINVPVGESRTYYAKLDGHDLGSPNNDKGEQVELNLSSGLRSNPPTWQSDDEQFTWMWGAKHLNLSGIKRISLSVQYNMHDKEVTIDNIRLRANPAMDKNFLVNIVDKYGQNAKAEFAEKIHSDKELQAKTQQELAELKANQLMDDRSDYSGWKKGPKLRATGYFRTEKVDGKWWLVDPQGYLYLATGIDIIRLANSTTMTGYDFDQALMKKRDTENVTPEDSQGLNTVDKNIAKTRQLVSSTRANMFEWLPESYDDPLADHFGYRKSAHSGPLKHGEVFSFYSANLERKYGESSNNSFLTDWKNVTVDRMRNWGFTSLGNWTDPMFYDNAKIPFFANGWVIGDYKTVSSGNDFWSPMPDVFDPEFARRAEVTVKQIAAEVNNSPWCVGVFIDNEKSWGRSNSRNSELGIVIHTLTRDGKDSPTKAKFTQVMRDKYADISKLNQAWGTDIQSWLAFDQGQFDSSLTNEVQDADYGHLLYVYAQQYFKVVSGKLKQYMPNHLYFGVRFASWGMPKEVIKASIPYTDVVSYNHYKQGVTDKKWQFLQEIDKPSMIGEFHFGAKTSGFFHPGLIQAADQQDRAAMYKDYMRSVFNNDYFIGAHWFQYMDSPITGRAYDGENYNVGFVTVADIPYEEMVKAAKELHSEMYQKRFERKANN
ncbi:GTPase EngC [Catenovulum agarivorans DS-2]|uniref:GTPase EngC n=1 Tax=Catenovulum agarivorans DS-2 TaxID=1328313 RepID=W7QIP3_9ALTE|nr:beta-galactosidase [Catenovulum agarivorans]EWH11721.1 GTPase EngC [Catenovulum agarivorans DS-2]